MPAFEKENAPDFWVSSPAGVPDLEKENPALCWLSVETGVPDLANENPVDGWVGSAELFGAKLLVLVMALLAPKNIDGMESFLKVLSHNKPFFP